MAYLLVAVACLSLLLGRMTNFAHPVFSRAVLQIHNYNMVLPTQYTEASAITNHDIIDKNSKYRVENQPVNNSKKQKQVS